MSVCTNVDDDRRSNRIAWLPCLSNDSVINLRGKRPRRLVSLLGTYVPGPRNRRNEILSNWRGELSRGYDRPRATRRRLVTSKTSHREPADRPVIRQRRRGREREGFACSFVYGWKKGRREKRKARGGREETVFGGRLKQCVRSDNAGVTALPYPETGDSATRMDLNEVL